MTEPKLYRQDGAAVRQVRRERGIKVPRLAEMLDTAPSTLYGIETDRSQCSWELLYRIAGALEVPIQRLLTDPESVAS